MGRKKGRLKIPETLISIADDDNKLVREVEREKGGGGFFACYLLTSLSPTHKAHTYIGFTVNPCRRIRQHNGEITCGALRTKKKRPWEMVLCIYGFPTNVSALQFEWAWQHPRESLAVRKAAATFKSLSGIANKVKLAYTMLTLPAWQSLNLTVNFFSTKYANQSAGCPTLPEHMKVQVCSMDELPCYLGAEHNVDGNEEDFQDDEASYGHRYVKEGSIDTTVNKSVDHQKSHEENGSIGEITLIPSRDFLMNGEDSRHPVCFTNSSVQVSSLFVSSSYSAFETMESRDVFGLIEESGVELDRPTRKRTIEVEIIDVLSPSPSDRVGPHSKKRRVSTVCPEIIDLTMSPIFV